MSPGEAYARALGDEPVTLRTDDGEELAVPVDRWLGSATAVDELVLARAVGPVLDVGCGPGRHVRALARRGVWALGLDVSPAAIALAQRRGAVVVQGSVFDRVPGAGDWQSALLLDGNVGIGGQPERLLRRVASVIAPGGRVLVEVDPPGTPTRIVRARLRTAAGLSDPFRWAIVGADGIAAVAHAAGLRPAGALAGGGRWFAELASA